VDDSIHFSCFLYKSSFIHSFSKDLKLENGMFLFVQKEEFA
jgi:hypothetical protein